MTLSIVDTGPLPPPKYPVFGTEKPSLNLIKDPDAIVPGTNEGSAFALALDAARNPRATLNAAPGTAAVVSVA